MKEDIRREQRCENTDDVSILVLSNMQIDQVGLTLKECEAVTRAKTNSQKSVSLWFGIRRSKPMPSTSVTSVYRIGLFTRDLVRFGPLNEENLGRDNE